MFEPMALPIDAHLPLVQAAVLAKRPVIIQAEPGAGKTTRVPACLLKTVSGRILVLEPRRLAARLSAERVASECQEKIGQTVGYQIRLESKVSDATRLIFVTEGVFLRLVLDCPDLAGVDAVVIDEFHERHVHSDLALAIVQKLRQSTRPDLALIIMSATLDAAALGAFLPDAEQLVVKGRTFPVAVEYQVTVEHQGVSESKALEEQLAKAARAMIADPRCPGDILVFLSGLYEIRRMVESLQRLPELQACDILALAAEVTPQEQMRVFAPSNKRKIILSTNVAETSLTIPGVTGVIDAGLAKIAGHATWSGMPTLDVKRVSQASCIQRMGRAGRMQAGVCYRLYTLNDYLARPAFTVPDIHRLDFTETYLEVLGLSEALGDPTHDVSTALPWFESPEPRSIESARGVLQLLGAIDAAGTLTPIGRQMAEIPLHPRLAAIIVRGKQCSKAGMALLAACILSEKSLLARAAPALTRLDCDVRWQCELYLKATKRRLSPAERAAIDSTRYQRVERTLDLLSRRLRIPLPSADIEVPDLGDCLLAGFPDRLATLRTGSVYNLALGRGAVLAETSVARDQRLILAIDAAESPQARSADRGSSIYMAAAIQEEHLLAAPPALTANYLRRSMEAVWMASEMRVDVMQRLYYGQLLLQEKRLSLQDEHRVLVEELLAQKLAEHWPKPFVDDSDLSSYHQRLLLLEQHLADAGGAGDYLRFEGESFSLLLAAICEGKRSFHEIAARELNDYIADQLSYEARERLERVFPSHVQLSNGRRLAIRYEPDRPPYVSGYIQDFYGERQTPSVAQGRLALSVHLLAPNKRPVQVTSDLAGFWQQFYPSLKRELSRQYPRHHWPDEPLLAPPVLLKSRL